MTRSLVALVTALLILSGCDGTGQRPMQTADTPAPSPEPPTSPPDTTETEAPKGRGKAAIVVTEPRPGNELTSPFELEGSANVFEATVSYRLVADGTRLAKGFTTATCGSGCRGTYSKRVRFNVDEPTTAVLQVFEASAEDGSPLHMVEVEVTLLP